MIKDFKIIRGDSLVISFTLTSNGLPYILQTNDNLYFSIKQNAQDNTAMIKKSTSSGIAYNSTTGKYEITLSSSDTQYLLDTSLVYDIELVMSDGIVITLCMGHLFIDLDVTMPINRS